MDKREAQNQKSQPMASRVTRDEKTAVSKTNQTISPQTTEGTLDPSRGLVARARTARVLQRKVGNGRTAHHFHQDPIQRKENKTGLPNDLKTGVETLSGYSMDDVKVHYNSSKPAQLQAHAYTQGSNIHVAPRQEKFLPHEAWHVVQQKQGRVTPTIQTKGIAINDDKGLEHEADVMGKRALDVNGSAMPSPNRLVYGRSSIQQFAIIQRQEIPIETRKQSGLNLSEEQWQKLEHLLDVYGQQLGMLEWFHGTTSPSLILASLTNGQLVPAGDLIKQGISPLSGEAGNALDPNYTNKVGMSGVGLSDLDTVFDYTKPKIEEQIRELYKNMSPIIKEAKELIDAGIKLLLAGGQYEGNGFVRVRSATVKLCKMVWSIHLFADDGTLTQHVVNELVYGFNDFINERYRTNAESAAIQHSIEELVQVFNNTVDRSLDSSNSQPIKLMLGEEFPVVYSAVGNKDIVKAEHKAGQSGEKLLGGANIPPKEGVQGTDNEIQLVFVHFDQLELSQKWMMNQFAVEILPIELLKIFKLIKEPVKDSGLKNFNPKLPLNFLKK